VRWNCTCPNAGGHSVQRTGHNVQQWATSPPAGHGSDVSHRTSNPRCVIPRGIQPVPSTPSTPTPTPTAPPERHHAGSTRTSLAPLVGAPPCAAHIRTPAEQVRCATPACRRLPRP
jgi:hypothetical protein